MESSSGRFRNGFCDIKYFSRIKQVIVLDIQNLMNEMQNLSINFGYIISDELRHPT